MKVAWLISILVLLCQFSYSAIADDKNSNVYIDLELEPHADGGSTAIWRYLNKTQNRVELRRWRLICFSETKFCGSLVAEVKGSLSPWEDGGRNVPPKSSFPVRRAVFLSCLSYEVANQTVEIVQVFSNERLPADLTLLAQTPQEVAERQVQLTEKGKEQLCSSLRYGIGSTYVPKRTKNGLF